MNIQQIIQRAADRAVENIMITISQVYETLQAEVGEEEAEKLKGYVVDSVMGASEAVASTFLTTVPQCERPPDLDFVSKLAADRAMKKMAEHALPEVKKILGVNSSAS